MFFRDAFLTEQVKFLEIPQGVCYIKVWAVFGMEAAWI